MRWLAKRMLLLGAAAAATTVGSPARGSSALEYPDNGVAQFSRGGAWLAMATDPIAGHYNPATLALQPTSVGLGLNVAFQKICYERRGPDGEPEGPSPFIVNNGSTYPEVCNSNAGQPNVVPNLAVAWRVTRDLGLGLAIVPPSSYGLLEWPDVVQTWNPKTKKTTTIPAPQRYLSLYTKGTILFPTLSAGVNLTRDFSVGAGFVAGIALLEFRSMSISNVQQTNAFDDAELDTRSQVRVRDLFVPGFVLGTHWRATPNVDVGAWYRWIDKIRAKGDLEVKAPYFTTAGGKTDDPNVTKSEDQVGKDAAKITLTIPAEIRVGARWHVQRPAATGLAAEKLRQDALPTRDPLRDELYDVELDLTWADNSSADRVQIRFPDGINVQGLPGMVPPNADRPTGWKDSFGARLGGQWNALRNRLGVRVGTWVETSAVDEAYLTVTGVPALRGGYGGGLVLRIQRVDLEAGYQHIWNAGLDNGGNGRQYAIAGSGHSGNYRSYHAVNGGSVSQHANVFSLGAVARF